MRWTIEVGEGFAGPAVFEGYVYLLDRMNDQQDVLRCFDLEKGTGLWQWAYDAPGKLPYNGSRNVPTITERFIFTLGPFGQFHCLDRQTRQLLWSKHLINDFKDPQIDRSEAPTSREEKLARAQVPMWGLCQTPLLCRDLVLVAPQTQTIGLVAYEQSTGKIRWRSGYIGRNWYSSISPYLTTLCDVPQIIMLAQPSDPEKAPEHAPPAIIASLDPDTGQILWTNKTSRPHKIPIPQPLRVANDRLFITGGYGMGCQMLQVHHAAGRWDTQELFHNRTVAAHIHSPIQYQDRIYLTSLKDQGGMNSGLVCLNQDGDGLWQTGPELHFENGSYLIADGMAFILHGKTGQLHLLELTTSGYKLLAKAKVLTARHAMVWAPMALSQGKLIIRDQHQMKCLDVTAASIGEIPDHSNP